MGRTLDFHRRAPTRGTVAVLAGVALALTGPRASAAPAEAVPVLTGIDPPGVTVGSESEWTLEGRALAGVSRFLVSGTGVAVVAIGAAREDRISLRIRVSADAAPGFHELRGVGPSGISNMLLFRVDHLPQAREVEPNDEPAAA